MIIQQLTKYITEYDLNGKISSKTPDAYGVEWRMSDENGDEWVDVPAYIMNLLTAADPSILQHPLERLKVELDKLKKEAQRTLEASYEQDYNGYGSHP